MRLRFNVIPAALLLAFAATTFGQAPANSAPTVGTASSILSSALADVQSTTADLNISKWKLPGDVRKTAEADVESIQRDLGGTLPGLLTKADAAPGSVPPTFAVYRNVDALYDVLLRVSQMADLGAPSKEEVRIASSLRNLESARRQLADSIQNTAQRHETRLVALEAARANAASQVKHETIIVDGPDKKPAKKTRHRTTHKKPPPKS